MHLHQEGPDPERFGVVKFDDEGMFVDIIEKPEVPPSNSAGDWIVHV